MTLRITSVSLQKYSHKVPLIKITDSKLKFKLFKVDSRLKFFESRYLTILSLPSFN